MKSSSEREYYHEADRPIRSITVTPSTGPYSQSNRRVSTTCGVQRCYPWLLFATTAVAAAFCLAYITKPVIISESSDVLEILPPSVNNAGDSAQAKAILPSSSKLPGEKSANNNRTRSTAIPSAPNSQGFEETNLRMQHIFDAESPSGDIHRMVIDVPVLYKSRNLRWSQQEVAEARTLLKQLEQHQEQIRALRDQGKLLLHNWNALVNTSIPDQILRADSPSLPINQSNNKFSAMSPSSDAVKLHNDRK